MKDPPTRRTVPATTTRQRIEGAVPDATLQEEGRGQTELELEGSEMRAEVPNKAVEIVSSFC